MRYNFELPPQLLIGFSVVRDSLRLHDLTSARQEKNMATALKISAPEDKASRFISKTHKLLINGKWVDAASGKTFPTYNPATGEILAPVSYTHLTLPTILRV